MKIIVSYKNVDNRHDEDELIIKPLGWPEWYLHNQYSGIHLSLTEVDWDKIHKFVPLEIFHSVYPGKNLDLWGEDAIYFYERYIRECQRQFNEIIETQRQRLLNKGWKKTAEVKPEKGQLCLFAEPQQHEISGYYGSSEYPGWRIRQGKFDKYDRFETAHNAFGRGELWKYQYEEDY